MTFGKIAGAVLCAALAATLATNPAAAKKLPRPAHVIIVMEENHSYADIIGSQQAPYIIDKKSEFSMGTARAHLSLECCVPSI